ncbi:DUF3078 domain-containing protein [Sediminicola sp. 1XM1-17]|uniref:DUF3078 domain-containing protein n=1 Tax=Sediminicola sp. 1XM1-17 TaxID=3127702 RepID=UPI00307876FB
MRFIEYCCKEGKKWSVFLLFFLGLSTMTAQDTIPVIQPIDTTAVDTTIVDTIVIRAVQSKIRNIPRSVNLTNPIVSFKKTKARTKEFRQFQVPSFWHNENVLKINFNEVAFVNWKAGGDNSIAAAGNLKFVKNYKFRYIQWDNDLEFRYGLNAQEGRKVRKTEDLIRLSSTFGYRRDTLSNWYYSVKANFNTQFSNGYKYPDRTTPISRFMAPGYLFLGAGTSFIPDGKKFNLYISPITQKATYVLDQTLANQGAFGVKKASYDAEGNVIAPGENVFMEFGFLVTNTWQKEIFDNVFLDHRINLYTDYLRRFGNIDVDWELNLKLVVNKYIQTNIGTQLIYDDDIKFDEIIADDGTIVDSGGPRIQFKQILGVGVAYTF